MSEQVKEWKACVRHDCEGYRHTFLVNNTFGKSYNDIKND